jgi:hypothetical protein
MVLYIILYLYYILYIYTWLKIHQKKLLKDDKKKEMFCLLVAMLLWLHKKVADQREQGGDQHQGREIIAIVPLENGAFCTIFSENSHKF